MIEYENNCVGPCPMGCINCGRKHEAVHYCDRCGEVIEDNGEDRWNEDGRDEYCRSCYLEDVFEETANIDDALEFGATETETVEINSMLQLLFKADEIEHILIEEFKKNPPEMQKLYIEKAITENNLVDEWLEYFKE